jgi:peptidoglycan-associated lipoprotein
MIRISLLLILAATLLAGGCASKKTVELNTPAAEDAAASVTASAGSNATADQASAPPRATLTTTDGVQLEAVYFDYNAFTLSAPARQSLERNASWLQANLDTRVTIEGHCDERGSDEYNLALGERRALAVKRYLAALGVDAERLATISYGEERPAVAGHDESAWAKNRRAELR